jgi:hypothetical protein
MLSVFNGSAPTGRRAMLRAGTLGLGGLALSHLMGLKAEAAAELVKDKSVVFLFMQGGPSQIETFDPKITAPAGIQSATGEVQTTVPGMTFGGTFPLLAKQAHRVSIVRSFATGDGNHDIKPLVTKDLFKASLGAIYSRVGGPMHPQKGIPRSAMLYPEAVEAKGKKASRDFGNHADAGVLGSAYTPFIPGTGPLNDNMRLNLPEDRFTDRQWLLHQLDRINRDVDSGTLLTGMDKFQTQAASTILSNVADAFNLSREDSKVIARYDTSGLMTPDQISRAWNNHSAYVSHVKTLGKLMLLARRLCESGVGFVTVTTDFVWDNHADSNNAGVEEGMRYCGHPFDHAVSTFIEDVHQRGLSDKILLVCCGEMGRSPRMNSRGGRDHWGNLAPLLLSGGGLQMGKVIGQSTRDAAEPLSEKVTIGNLLATLGETMFDVPQMRLRPDLPPELVRLFAENKAIPGLS